MSTKREIQLCQLQILKAVSKVCEDNDIDYTLTGGSLIGAIRHKGFIPWDDDIDISMTAENYKKFCKIGQKCLGDDFFVQNWRTEKEFSELWTQVRMNNTTSMPLKYKKWNIHFGIHIDIFPIIGLFDDEERRQKQFKWFKICKSMIVKDYMSAVNEKPKGKQIIINSLPSCIRKAICNSFEKKWLISSEGTMEASEVWLGLNYIYPSNLYKDYILVDFEGYKFKAISGYDEYLTLTYGDYMTPPPESDRKGHMGEVLQAVKDPNRGFEFYKNRI